MKLTRERIALSAAQPLPGGIFKQFAERSNGEACEGCGLRLDSSETAIKIPGVAGVFCSNLCCEQGLIYDRKRCRACAAKLGEDRAAHYCDDACRKSIADEPWGSGKRFLRWLALDRPELYRQLFEVVAAEEPPTTNCLECGVRLEGRRPDSRFCSDTHKKRFSRKAKTAQKCGIIRDTPIQKQGLTGAQNASWTNLLTAPVQALKNAPNAKPVFPDGSAA